MDISMYAPAQPCAIKGGRQGERIQCLGGDVVLGWKGGVLGPAGSAEGDCGLCGVLGTQEASGSCNSTERE